MDGVTVAPENYVLGTDANGKLTVTLTDAYLSGLTAGEHTLKLRFTRGTSTGTFTR